MIGFAMDANALLIKNGIKGELKSFETTFSSGFSGLKTVELTDGRVLHFSRKGYLKKAKEKVLTRKERRQAIR